MDKDVKFVLMAIIENEDETRACIGSGGGAIPIPTEEAEIAIETLEIINKG